LYRRFATKDLLVDAVVLSEVFRYLEGNALARSRGSTFEESIAEGTAHTVQFLRGHALLKKLIDTEPETILPSFTVDGGAIIDLAREQAAALMRVELYGDTASVTGPGTTPPDRRGATHPPDPVVHPHSAHQHRPRHSQRRPDLRTHLHRTDGHP
jgi:hypothetical protein